MIEAAKSPVSKVNNFFSLDGIFIERSMHVEALVLCLKWETVKKAAEIQGFKEDIIEKLIFRLNLTPSGCVRGNILRGCF